MSPIVTYRTMRDDGLTITQIQSICRQILSMADKDEREELERLQRETKALVEKRARERPEEPWEDAPGIMLTGSVISYPDGTRRYYTEGDCPE